MSIQIVCVFVNDTDGRLLRVIVLQVLVVSLSVTVTDHGELLACHAPKTDAFQYQIGFEAWLSWTLEKRPTRDLVLYNNALDLADNSWGILDRIFQRCLPGGKYPGTGIGRGSLLESDSLWCPKPFVQTRTFLEGGRLQSSHCEKPLWGVNWFLQKHWNSLYVSRGRPLSDKVNPTLQVKRPCRLEVNAGEGEGTHLSYQPTHLAGSWTQEREWI